VRKSTAVRGRHERPAFPARGPVILLLAAPRVFGAQIFKDEAPLPLFVRGLFCEVQSQVPEIDDRLNGERQRRLKAARRVVIKVGTSTVTGPKGEFSIERVEPIARSISQLMKAGRQVVLVSSGAVGLGRGRLGLHPARLRELAAKQACAAVGQSLLMDSYQQLFSLWGIRVAQVLLTEEDFSNWRRYANLKRTIERLMGFGVLAIVNENDTVSTAELESVDPGTRLVAFSDNDRLAALVMSGLDADVLVLLTNVDGLHRANPHGKSGESAKGEGFGVIPVVSEVTRELRALGAGPSSGGRGGMQTKIESAEIAMQCGGIAVIASAQYPDTVKRIFDGEAIGTTFLSTARMRGKRRWIAFAAGVQGRIVVDPGAYQAITEAKASLLVSGVVRVESPFGTKDVVSLVDSEGHEFARGIARCASHEVRTGKKKRNSGSARRRTSAAGHVLVSRDDIVVFREER